MLQKLKAIVMTMLGIDAFNIKDGKVVFLMKSAKRSLLNSEKTSLRSFRHLLKRNLPTALPKTRPKACRRPLML